MTTHAQTPRTRRRSGRVRALLSLGVIAVLATGMSVKGTFAFWTDSATVQTGTFSSGTLDITVNGQLAGTGNNGGTAILTGFALADMVPGESQAVSFPLTNVGTVGLTYTISGTASGGLAPGMRFSVHAGGSVAGGGGRNATCTGGQVLAADRELGAAPSTVAAVARTLAKGATENICVRAQLSPGAGNALQGQSMTANLVFDAKQIGA